MYVDSGFSLTVVGRLSPASGHLLRTPGYLEIQAFSPLTDFMEGRGLNSYKIFNRNIYITEKASELFAVFMECATHSTSDHEDDLNTEPKTSFWGTTRWN